MRDTSLQEMETYVSRRQNTLSQYILTRPIVDLCMVAKRSTGTRVAMRWWEQWGVYLEWMRTAAWEADQTEGGGGDGRDVYCN